MTWTRKPLVTEGEAFRNDHPVSGAQTNDHTEVNTMKRNSKRIFVALLAICALAAGGAAFTHHAPPMPLGLRPDDDTAPATPTVLDQTGEDHHVNRTSLPTAPTGPPTPIRCPPARSSRPGSMSARAVRSTGPRARPRRRALRPTSPATWRPRPTPAVRRWRARRCSTSRLATRGPAPARKATNWKATDPRGGESTGRPALPSRISSGHAK